MTDPWRMHPARVRAGMEADTEPEQITCPYCQAAPGRECLTRYIKNKKRLSR
jgi:hypothetical protein